LTFVAIIASDSEDEEGDNQPKSFGKVQDVETPKKSDKVDANEKNKGSVEKNEDKKGKKFGHESLDRSYNGKVIC
jgi:hypothetical protein